VDGNFSAEWRASDFGERRGDATGQPEETWTTERKNGYSMKKEKMKDKRRTEDESKRHEEIHYITERKKRKEIVDSRGTGGQGIGCPKLSVVAQKRHAG